MKFSFVTLFPSLIEGYFSASILKRAVEAGLVEIECINPRDYSDDRYKKVDSPMIGGGAGMLMSPQPISDAIERLQEEENPVHTVFLSPAGKAFTQNDARRLATYSHIVLVSGRYEGIDERVIEMYADEVFSTGDFVLTGGELPALIVCDAVSRNIDGVLGNMDSLVEESFEDGLLESPAFTKPDDYKGSKIVSEFLKGNHSRIAAIKKLMALYRTKYYRPDLYSIAKANHEKQIYREFRKNTDGEKGDTRI